MTKQLIHMEEQSNKLYHYVYRITNTIINKHYYGVRSSRIPSKEDIGIKYFSSSTDVEFLNDQKNNPQNYKYKVVNTFDTRKDAMEYEILLHKKFDVGVNESFYNRCKATSSRFSTTGIAVSEETRIKMSNSRKGKKNGFYGKKHSEETRKMLSEINKGENNPWYGLTGKMCHNYGRKHSEESKRVRSGNSKGMKNHFYGKKHSEESKQKMREFMIGKYDGKKNPSYNHIIYEFFNTRTNEIYIMTQNELLNHLKGSPAGISLLVNNKSKQYKGVIVKRSDNQLIL